MNGHDTSLAAAPDGSTATDRTRRPVRTLGFTIGAALLVVLVAAVLAGPLVVAYEPNAIDPPAAFEPPSWQHPMGTDNLGRDVLARFLAGGRVSLLVGVGAIALGGTIGVTLGVVAGLFGRYVDAAISWVVEVLQAFPGVLLALAVITMLGPGLQNVLMAVGVAFIPSFARMARALVLSLRERTFVESARAIGNPPWRIVARHLLPNTLRSLTVLATLGLGAAILEGAALSFLGLGLQPPDAEWGAMLGAGSAFLRVAWWLTVFPGLGVFMAILGANLIGEGISDARSR